MVDPFFFGYGSLVNRATHGFSRAYPAKLHGWQRVWRQTSLRDVAFLSVEPAEGVTIDGLIAAVPGGDWQELEKREWAYERVPASKQVSHSAPQVGPVELFSIHDRHRDEAARHAIRLSYLDVVLQGYLREFGEAGAWAFVDTTQGWDIPVWNDRAEPIYPRHQPLTELERGFVDEALRTVPAEIVPVG